MRTLLLALLLLIPNLSWGLELLCKINKTFLYFDGNFYTPKEFNLYTDQPNEFDIFVKINNEGSFFTYRRSDSKEYYDLKFNIKINEDFYYTHEEAFKENPFKAKIKEEALIKINRKTGFMTWVNVHNNNEAKKSEFYCEKSEVKF